MSFPVVLFVLTVRLPTMVSMSRPRTSLPPTLLADIFVRFVLFPVADPGMDLLNLTLQWLRGSCHHSNGCCFNIPQQPFISAAPTYIQE